VSTTAKVDDLRALTERAQNGDRAVLPALREVLKHPPAVDQLGGDLARDAQRALLSRFSGKNLLRREAVKRKLELLRNELAGASATPVERLLVERVVTCWLHLHTLEVNYATPESRSIELDEHFERRLSAAQNRYLAAIRTLAQVRKLVIPVLQVNIAQQQVNVAGAAAPD
jgi:hypothetical protein